MDEENVINPITNNEEVKEELPQDNNALNDTQEAGINSINNTVEDDLDFEEEEENNIVSLTDEFGKTTDFQYLDIIEVDGVRYLILLPLEDDEETEEDETGECVIFAIENDEEGESYVGVNDPEVAAKVFNIFKDRSGNRFNFVD